MARASSRLEKPVALSGAAISAAAEELGVPLSLSQADLLARYAALLQQWNAVHNLTSLGSPAEILTHHLLDSLAILPSIDDIVGQKPLSVLDVGSGGGLPGIPLAVARPAFDVTLIDKVGKKVAFLTQAALELALPNAHALHGRVEAIALPRFTLVVSRAFASLAQFVAVTKGAVAADGWWAAMKGALPRAELDALRTAHPEVRVVDAIRLRIPRLEAERHLILLQRPRCP